MAQKSDFGGIIHISFIKRQDGRTEGREFLGKKLERIGIICSKNQKE